VRLRRAIGPGLLLALVAAALPAQEPGFKVIVHAENPVAATKRDQVAILFLNRRTSWSHGPASAPVDLSMTSPVREVFSSQVLGQSLLAVSNHWRKRMLEAREVPPPVKSSDEEVIAHVAKNPGGIGYVSAAATLPPTVKELRIADLIR
jgi:ABC-type phosphate transport system substrate-binding protein